MRTTPSDMTALVLHGRQLNEILVSTVADLTTAVSNSAVDKILVAAGVYNFTTDMCTDSFDTSSAICIDRAVTIEALVPGSVVFDGNGERRVFIIQSGGTAALIGLNITGGSATYVPACCILNMLHSNFINHPLELDLASGSQGGGVYVTSNGVANFEDCNIHDNTAYRVCLPSALALNFHSSPRWRLTLLSRLVGRWRFYP